MKLRAHHLYCAFFADSSFCHPERGKDFLLVEERVKRLMKGDSDEQIELVMGIDDVCHVCPFYEGDSCQHPNGGDDNTRKHDSIILKGLDVPAGTAMPADEWCEVFKRTSPLSICQNRCPFRSHCRASQAT